MSRKLSSPAGKTPTFSYVKRNGSFDSITGWWYELKVELPGHGCLKRVCYRQHWTLGSCGVDALANMYCPEIFDNGKYLDEFIQFLGEIVDPQLDTWTPDELLFSLSCTQLDYCSALISHPRVKKLDRWTNKAHGPNDIHLFRISLKGDFKHVS